MALHARETDPATSHEAVPRNIAYLMLVALRTYRHGNAMIDHDAGRLCNRDVHQRCSDLRRKGYIERDGTRGITPSLKSAYRCRITALGSAFLAFIDG